MSLDTYRSNANRKRQEITRLSEQKAGEQKKIAVLNTKIQGANRSISSTKSVSTIQSRQNEIVRYQAEIARVEKNIADFEYKLAQKNKELQAELKRLSDEEVRESKRHHNKQMELHEQYTRTFQSVKRTLNEHDEAIVKLSTLPKMNPSQS